MLGSVRVVRLMAFDLPATADREATAYGSVVTAAETGRLGSCRLDLPGRGTWGRQRL